MKRLMLVVMVVFFVMVSFFPGVSHARKAPYLVGANIALTGYMSAIGVANKRGLEIAVEEINSKGGVNGRQLEVIVYNGESDVAKGMNNIKRLIDVDKVVALVGDTQSMRVLASVNILERKEIAEISASPTEKQWIPTKKWIFCVVPRQKDASINMLLEYLVQRGAKKIAYIYCDYIYGTTGLRAFNDLTQKMKITPAIVEKYAMGSTDVGPQMSHIMAAGADAILITGLTTDTVMVIKAARNLGFKGIIVSDFAVVSPEFVDLAGKYGEGIVSTSLKTMVAPDLPDNDKQKKVCMDLYTKYTNRYGDFSLYSGHTWDGIYLLTEALKKVDPNLDPAKPDDLVKIRAQIRDNLEKIKGFVGQNGIFSYSPDNHLGLAPRPYVLVVIKQGRWRLLLK